MGGELAGAVIPLLPAPGLDVSQYQGVIDWPAVAAAGYRFVFIRASSGKKADTRFEANYRGAGEAGLLRGAYHYVSAVCQGQVALFASVLDGRHLELGHWADLEDRRLAVGKIAAFLDTADANMAHVTHVYTSIGFWNRLPLAPLAAGRRLWVAHWHVNEPKIPKGWDSWEFWQYTDRGQVPGIQRAVDLDTYRGTVKELAAVYG